MFPFSGFKKELNNELIQIAIGQYQIQLNFQGDLGIYITGDLELTKNNNKLSIKEACYTNENIIELIKLIGNVCLSIQEHEKFIEIKFSNNIKIKVFLNARFETMEFHYMDIDRFF